MRALSGDVEFGGRIGRNGRYDMLSRTGQVLVTPAGNEGFEVDVITRNGGFRSDFPLTLRERSPGSRRGNKGQSRARQVDRNLRRRRRIADTAVLQRRHCHRTPLKAHTKTACVVAPALLRWRT